MGEDGEYSSRNQGQTVEAAGQGGIDTWRVQGASVQGVSLSFIYFYFPLESEDRSKLEF